MSSCGSRSEILTGRTLRNAVRKRASATPWPPRSATRSRSTGRFGGVENIEIRLHRTVLYNSIYRADDQLLVNQHTYGIPAAQAPVFCLSDTDGGEMAALYLDSFERVWTSSAPLA